MISHRSTTKLGLLILIIFLIAHCKDTTKVKTNQQEENYPIENIDIDPQYRFPMTVITYVREIALCCKHGKIINDYSKYSKDSNFNFILAVDTSRIFRPPNEIKNDYSIKMDILSVSSILDYDLDVKNIPVGYTIILDKYGTKDTSIVINGYEDLNGLLNE